MNPILYTAGHGNDTPKTFLNRLHGAGVNYVLDVRRPDSRSWCWQYHPGARMSDLMHDASPFIFYWLLSFHKGSIHFGKDTEETMDDYRNRIINRRHRQILESIALLIETGEAEDLKPVRCVICACRKHENCHRTVFAEELLNRLNEYANYEPYEWVIEHI